MSRLRVLVVCHNHPSFHPGGTEIFAHELFQELRQDPGIEPLFLACTNQLHRDQKPGTSFQTVGRSADELVLWAGHFDRFFMSQIDLHGVVPDLSNLLLSFRPDVVHFHHTLLLGAEILYLVRRLLPESRIVFTLHDYYPICPNDGLMVRTGSNELCHGATLDGCRRCFPDVAPDRFVLRERHLKALFQAVDAFVAPSHFLRDRFIRWGLPAEAIHVIPNGRPEVEPTPHRRLAHNDRRDSFAYFGNISPFKGASVAVAAAQRLIDAGDLEFSLQIHGGTPFQTDAFRSGFAAAAEAAAPQVSQHGPYSREEFPTLIGPADWVIMPSIWWENAPLVIQEAFQHRRPVICSGIGGMAEMVRDGIDGLHFRPGDANDLARVMWRAMTEPSLWQYLVDGIPEVPTLTAQRYLALFDRLLADEEPSALAVPA